MYRFDGAMIVCDKKSIFVSITEIMRNKSESISRSTMMGNNNYINKVRSQKKPILFGNFSQHGWGGGSSQIPKIL